MEIEKLVLLLVGGVIGFIASILKDYFIEKTKRKYKEIELKREKAEELYLLLDRWSILFFSQKNRLILVMEDKLNYDDYFDYIINESEKDTNDYKRIEMLINIYFKDFSKKYERVREQMSKVNSIESFHKNEYYIDGKIYAKSVLDNTLKVIEYIDDLKEDIASTCKSSIVKI